MRGKSKDLLTNNLGSEKGSRFVIRTRKGKRSVRDDSISRVNNGASDRIFIIDQGEKLVMAPKSAMKESSKQEYAITGLRKQRTQTQRSNGRILEQNDGYALRK